MQKCISSARSWRLKVNRYPILQLHLINRPSISLCPADLPIGYGPSSTLLFRCVSACSQFLLPFSCLFLLSFSFWSPLSFSFWFLPSFPLSFSSPLLFVCSVAVYLLSLSSWSFVSVYPLSFQLGGSSSCLLQLGLGNRCVSCGCSP